MKLISNLARQVALLTKMEGMILFELLEANMAFVKPKCMSNTQETDSHLARHVALLTKREGMILFELLEANMALV